MPQTQGRREVGGEPGTTGRVICWGPEAGAGSTPITMQAAVVGCGRLEQTDKAVRRWQGETGSARTQETSCQDTLLGGRSCLHPLPPPNCENNRSATLASSPRTSAIKMSLHKDHQTFERNQYHRREREARTFPRLP